MRALPKIDRRLSDWLSNSLRFALGPVEPDAKLHDIPATISPKVLDARTYDLAQAEVTTVQPDCSSNQDAEGDRVWVESSEDDDSDDEYVPPTMPSLTQRRSYRKAKAAVAASSTGVMPSYSPPQTPRTSRPTQLARTSDTSRSSAHGTAPTATKRRCARGTGEPNFDSIDEKRNYVCLTCSRRFRGDRHADFKRHVMGHYPDKAFGKLGTVTCCGVPVESRDKYRVPASASTEYFEGLPMVGGCGKRFSRNDSLRRHLANPKTGCVGDLNGEWHLSKNKE
ncbi:hypothetical protein BDW22DRAFT_925728 [Trametopsis cervina]|nr:hypothetical protein BDW22DRAFT_925728 [Trametopsis cervina]